MSTFRDPEAAERAKERLEALTHLDLSALFPHDFEDAPDPDLALTNLERWLRATSNPGTHMQHLLELRPLCRLLLTLLAASQPVADSLIQNPELAGIVTDAGALETRPSPEGLLREGRALLAAANSYSHKLDRLRYLKQRWTLPIVVNDLAHLWSPEEVWRALSDLADACITLSVEAVWSEFRSGKELPERCPISVIAFGKLGGHELNYSSDVDLVYVLDDGVDEALEKQVTRFSETLTRAMADRMGRGSLYRVDLRLRPFGKAGPIAPTMRAIEAYYRSHAEVWEMQALVRSRPISGSHEVAVRWHELVDRSCFAGPISEATLTTLLQNRERIEEYSTEGDLKRGAGGIRDVEFLTQLLQMACGFQYPQVRAKQTCEALRNLLKACVLTEEKASALIEGYVFLRQLEHRCQLVGDQQTHEVPIESAAREHLARLSGNANWNDLEAELEAHRADIRQVYDEVVGQGIVEQHGKAALAERLGPVAGQVFTWIGSLPESGAFLQSLAENQDSLDRVRRIAEFAPSLLPDLVDSVALTESIFSGEIEEETDSAARIRALPTDAPLELLGNTLHKSWLRTLAAYALGEHFDLGLALSEVCDAVIDHACRRLYAQLDLIALGSYAIGDMGPSSDCDVLLLVKDPGMQAEAESQAQQLIALLTHLKRYGIGLSLDLRLRPEGGKGLLVRTYAGLKAYELEAMEMWERFALGHARGVVGSPEALDVVLKTAYALPLTPERVRELVAMKRRIETERVLPQHYKRHVKLGYGSLSDIEWFVHLHEMRFPTAAEAGKNVRLPERIRALYRAQIINAVELEELLEARAHLLRTRDRLALLGYDQDILPENPDKLDSLAHAFGFSEGNAFLAYHERVVEAVRSIYLEGLDRLRA